MTGKEIVKEIMAYRKWSQAKLADEIGKSQTNVTGYLNRGKNEMRLDVFTEMVEAMGFEVIVKDKMGSNKKFTVKLNSSKVDLDAILSDDGEPVEQKKKNENRIKLK